MLSAQHCIASLPCAVCGNNQTKIIAKKDRNGQPLTNVMCVNCGLVWVDPQPTIECTEKFYSSEYRKQYKKAFQPKHKHCYREALRAIDRTTRFLSVYRDGMRVLDVGSGAGFFAYILQRMGILIDGIEPNEEYANYALSNLHLNTIRTGFLRDLTTENEYDLITINHVFEHLPNPREAMLQIHKLLKKGGHVLMEIPNIEATYHAPNKIFHVGHLYWYNPNTIRALALQLGFVIDDVQIINGTKHINIVLTKSDESPASEIEVNSLVAGNAENVSEVLQQHTLLRHFLTPAPYVRFLRKSHQYFKEQIYIKKFKNGKDICDSVCNKLFSIQNPKYPGSGSE
ncbi:MAG: class I SAM-dependent methyltransferase [Methylomicrobium sp.]|nr:class I SAM-dependent methyltransferase [Methylomicrobium sp.]